MPDIFHTFPILASAEKVFGRISTPSGLDSWWTKSCAGQPGIGNTYNLDFGPSYKWRAKVIRYFPEKSFELLMLDADDDWRNTTVCFDLQQKEGMTEVQFAHKGWPFGNEHYRVSSFCWAMYLRLMKRNAETGETIPYEKRLEV
jgi:uncharacterized protein YndB with AHSA1/START domain